MGNFFDNHAKYSQNKCDSYVNQNRKLNILCISCQFSWDGNRYGSINLGLILELYFLQTSSNYQQLILTSGPVFISDKLTRSKIFHFNLTTLRIISNGFRSQIVDGSIREQYDNLETTIGIDKTHLHLI